MSLDIQNEGTVKTKLMKFIIRRKIIIVLKKHTDVEIKSNLKLHMVTQNMTSVLKGSVSPLYICPCTGCLYETCTCHSSWQNHCWCLTSLQSVHVNLLWNVKAGHWVSMQHLTTVHSDQCLISINHYHDHLLFINWGVGVITVMNDAVRAQNIFEIFH